MKNVSILFLLIISLGINVQLSAQSAAALKYFEDSDYAMVIEELEDDPNPSKESLRLMAKSAVMMNDMDLAEDLYNRLLTDNSVRIKDMFEFADILRTQGKYKESQEWMEELVDIAPEDSRAKAFEEDKDYYLNLLEVNDDFELVELNINSPHIDFGPAYFGDQLVFSSSRYFGKKKNKANKGSEFMDMYLSEGDRQSGFSGVRPFFDKINDQYNEGPVAFNEEGTYMVITRNNYGKTSGDGVRRLELFSSKLKDGDWTNAAPLPWNDKSYSCAHATLNDDATVMYFSSDMLGGQGGTDIYKVTRVKNGLWSEPVNVGPPINTPGDELFPFIHESGMLVFASNGHLGLGGLDMFYAWVADGPNSLVLNLGTPVNSSKDDFGMILDKEMATGYFSSNRDGGKGGDDIYSFNMQELVKQRRIAGAIKDSEGESLTDADISILNGDNDMLGLMKTNDNGGFDMLVEDQSDLRMKINKRGYQEAIINLNERTPNSEINCSLVPSKSSSSSQNGLASNRLIATDDKTTDLGTLPNADEKRYSKPNGSYPPKTNSETYADYDASSKAYEMLPEVSASALAGLMPGDDLRKVGIRPVYYEVDDMTISEEAHRDVFTLIDFMNSNPTVHVEIQSYTDCRGWDKYNRALSIKRANFMSNWVKERISSPERLTAKGMGERNLVNNCGCGFTDENNQICSEEEHAKNRRTEFKILKH